MRRTAAMLVVGAFVVFASVASAADIRRPIYKAAPFVPPPFSWTGFYLGAHAGWGWSHFNASDPTGLGGGTTDANGFLGGLQLGYNYQIASYVIGVEGDISWANVKKSETDPFLSGTLKNDYFATAALRLGYAMDRWLVYAKGGAAWTRDKLDVTDAFGDTGTGRFNRQGWILGAGVEYAFTNNWSAKLEYNYLSFKSIHEAPTTTGGLVATPADVSLRTNLVKLGVNYRFF
jgi:outer membrane immunogenic protein